MAAETRSVYLILHHKSAVKQDMDMMTISYWYKNYLTWAQKHYSSLPIMMMPQKVGVILNRDERSESMNCDKNIDVDVE